MSTQPAPATPVESPLAPVEPFVDPDTAALYLQTSRRHVLEMVRQGLIPGYPLDPHAKKDGLEIPAVGAPRLHAKLRPAATWSTQTTKEGLMPGIRKVVFAR
jgi:hypothetical protein